MDGLTRILALAAVSYCWWWMIRWAVRAELSRAGIRRQPSVITEEVDVESRAVYTYPCPNCGCENHE